MLGGHPGFRRQVLLFDELCVNPVEPVNERAWIIRSIVELLFEAKQRGDDASGIDGLEQLAVDGGGATGKVYFTRYPFE